MFACFPFKKLTSHCIFFPPLDFSTSSARDGAGARETLGFVLLCLIDQIPVLKMEMECLPLCSILCAGNGWCIREGKNFLSEWMRLAYNSAVLHFCLAGYWDLFAWWGLKLLGKLTSFVFFLPSGITGFFFFVCVWYIYIPHYFSSFNLEDILINSVLLLVVYLNNLVLFTLKNGVALIVFEKIDGLKFLSPLLFMTDHDVRHHLFQL